MDLWKININNKETEGILNDEVKLHSKRLKHIRKKQTGKFKSSPTYKVQEMLCRKHLREIKKLNKRIKKIKI